MTGNEELGKIYSKKLFFQNGLAFLIFFIVTIISVISSTQIACDVMCVQYVQKQPPEVLFKKGVLENFAHLTERHLCWCFPVKLSKFLCWLLRLNPGERGERLISQLSWVAAWLLVTRFCPVHLVCMYLEGFICHWERSELGKVGE